jgi:hypothetical protein
MAGSRHVDTGGARNNDFPISARRGKIGLRLSSVQGVNGCLREKFSVFQIESTAVATSPPDRATACGSGRVNRTDAKLSARHLVARTPFADQALAAGQRRARLLFSHASPTALEVVIQFLRVFFYEGMEPVRIDMLCSDRLSAIERIVSRAPNLRHMLEDDPGTDPCPLRWAGRLILHEAPAMALGDPSPLAAELAAAGLFTAIIIANSDTRENIAIARAIRSGNAGNPAFAAPIYVQAGEAIGDVAPLVRYDGLRPKPPVGLLSTIPGSVEAGEVIEPFGMPDEIHSPDFLMGARERLAIKLHEAYRQRRNDAMLRQGETERTDLPTWGALDETYRQANRRAVDLIPSLRLAAGIDDWWNTAAGLPRELVADPAMLEKLSRMAHHSWRADRELDGWRPALVGDPARRLHTDLVDYDSLTEEKKELDREQIRLFAEFPHM